MQLWLNFENYVCSAEILWETKALDVFPDLKSLLRSYILFFKIYGGLLHVLAQLAWAEKYIDCVSAQG